MSKMFRGGIAVEFNAETNSSPMATAAGVENLLKLAAEEVRKQFGSDVKISVQTAFIRPQNRKPKGASVAAAPVSDPAQIHLEEAIASAEPTAEHAAEAAE